MANKKTGLPARLAEWIERRRPALIDEDLRDAIALELEVPPARLRKPLRACGLPLSPMVEGVRQESLAELERSLNALAEHYAASEPLRRRAIRAEVQVARQHAEWAARAAHAETRDDKQEVLLWLRTWLENPPLFPAWAGLRKSKLHDPTSG